MYVVIAGAGKVGWNLARELIAKYGDTAKAVAKDAARLRDKAGDTLIEHTEARPFTTLAAILGIGFLAGWLFRRH